MRRAAHSSSQVLGGERYRLITPQCETLWCSLCGRSVGRSDSCALREPPSLAWLDKLATTWNTVWSHIKPCLRAASDNPARFAGVRVLGVDERCVASPGPTSTGPRELIGIVDHSREGSPHGAGPLPGTERTPSTINSKTPPASSMPSISSSSLATLQVRCVAASSKTRPVTAHAQATPSTQVRNLLRASRDWLTKRQKERLREAFVADEAHISVEVAYLHRASARGLPPRHTRPRPMPGRTPHPAPTSLFHPRDRSPGPDPTQVEGRLLGLLRHSRSQRRAPPKPSTDIIELGGRTARGYRNPTNYQPRILLIAGDLDASTHTQLYRVPSYRNYWAYLWMRFSVAAKRSISDSI